MRRTTIAAMIMTAVALTMKAEPADPSQRRTIKLDNGTERVVQLMGDEYGYYWKSLSDNGCYREKPGEVNRFVEVAEQEMLRRASAQREAANNRRGAKGQLSKDNHSDLGYPCTKMDLTGNKRALAILVEYQDKLFSRSNAAEFENIFNKVNYTTGRNKGSVKDYFFTQSNNLLNLSFDVVGPVKVSKNCAYYGAPTETQNDAHASEMVSEAVALVNDQVDFSQYDWDGDGTVEMIVVIFAGLDQSSGGVADDIWAHKGSIEARYDNVYLQQYACAPELRKIKDEEVLNSIGTICHEMSHAFGLPDTYDQSTGNYGTDRWDIMGIGVHNDNGYTPAGYTAYDKMYCLWQVPVVLREDQNVSNIRPMSEGGNFYLIPNDGWDDEFYLLENRQQTEWDCKLPGHGMLIMHVDYDEELFYYNIINRTGTISNHTNDHERLGLVLADNDMTIDNSSGAAWYACYQGDLYPYLSNNSLTNTSTPNSMLYHKNIDDTYLLSKPVTNIQENSDGTMNFQFGNELASQTISHLTASNGKVRFLSDTEAKLVVDITNDGYLDFARKIGVYVYIKENGSYVIQQPRYSQTISLLVGETKTCEFPLSGLEDDTVYYAFLFYYKEPNTTTWVQMGSAYPFNMSDRNTFTITMDEESLIINQTGNTATLEATFHNESYKTYSRKIGLYTYAYEDGKSVLQDPRSTIIGNIEPYGDQRLSFTLNNLEEGIVYRAYFFYYPDESTSSSWKTMCGPYKIIYDPILGDVNGDGSVTIADAIAIANYILGKSTGTFIFTAADINKDNDISIADAVGVVNIILSDNWTEIIM